MKKIMFAILMLGIIAPIIRNPFKVKTPTFQPEVRLVR